ncbi:ISNCY family transposase [Cohnella xylanilytica]|uniref:ISNCY family transposase n=1 Tax=Cohnella xylanilytica TaxID=557555 RepID=A0A841U3M3_9BACL|nr:ISNCY family transposase [Cohnella xylanilytica]MBB6695327.1 ISNCY family transposase [Cohnella xylanilytica]
MSRAELKKVVVVEKIIGGHITNEEGAAVLGLSCRQIIRLKKKYLTEGGATALVHGNRGRKPAHALSDETKERVAALYSQHYAGSNNCHFAELLTERDALELSPSSVRRILLDKGMKQAKQRRRKKAHQPRERRSQAGALWQIDATPYAWLEDRAPAFTLHAAIDDATGIVVGAVFRPTECREGYSIVMQQGIQQYGIPLGLYSDRHTIFRSPNEKLTVEQELTGDTKPLSDFGKAMEELYITHIKAMTPQAKGRIERLWGTLQDRLVIELRLLGINTIEAANEVLPALLRKHNRKFAVEPKSFENAYMKLDSSIRLDYVFTTRERRTLGQGNTLSYANKTYTFAKPTSYRLDAKTVVEVRQTLSGEVIVWHDDTAIKLTEIEKPIRKPKQETKKASSAQPRKPAQAHPWKTTVQQNRIKRTTSKSDFQDALYSQHNSFAEALW